MNLHNRVAIVTGASTGIGEATAKLFASKGARVVITARRKDKLELLADEIKELNGEVLVIAGDITEESFHKELVESAQKEFGGIDIAFNNAGTMGRLEQLDKLELLDWQEVINTNLTSAFLAAKYQIPALLKRKDSSLIYTSSFVGYTASFPSMSAYSASKAGIIGLVQALAVEYGQQGVRVNALLPGATDTPMGREFANTPEVMDYVKNLYALKRIAQPEEIAQSALYLASSASSFTTGSALLVEGGVSVNRA